MGCRSQAKVVSLTRICDPQSRCTRDGNQADFLSDRLNVDMIFGICALRSPADLPNVASSRSFTSMSFGDIPADLNDTAKLKNRSLPSPGCLEEFRQILVAFSTAAESICSAGDKCEPMVRI
jgi:hypothetical protein